MARGGQILSLLCPNAEWKIIENNYDSINWYGKEPAITKAEFENALANYDNLKAAELAAKEAKRQEVLTKLGITAEEAQVLLS